jgi:hypothetical protein
MTLHRRRRFFFYALFRCTTLARMKNARGLLALILVVGLVDACAATEPLEKLADDFWTWRAQYAPFTGDDVNRNRAAGWRA